MSGLWLAIAIVLLAIVIVYYALFKILKFLYQRHLAWFVASIIFLSPFAFVLSQARDLLELLWIVLLTPFYSVFVLLIISPLWIARFYCLAFSILMIAQFLLQSGKHVNEPKVKDKYELFWARHLKRNVHFASKGQKRVNAIIRKGRMLVRKLWKHGSFVLAFILLATLTATFASSAAPTNPPRNPTYFEAQQFVASDKTASHPYVKVSYTCADFAADFRSNALGAGYECGIAFLYFPDNTCHALNCFNTTDKGLVFVEPQSDKFVNVTVGKSYHIEKSVSPVHNDTVMWYYVDWQMSSEKP
jgi:hypothetical protein